MKHFLKQLLILPFLATLMALFTLPTTAYGFSTDHCGEQIKEDLYAVAWNIVDDWSNARQAIRDELGTSRRYRHLKATLVSGQVECKHDPSPVHACNILGGSYYIGIPEDFEINLCESFMDHIRRKERKNRRACLAAAVVEAVRKNNLKSHSSSVDAGKAIFRYWKDRFGATNNYSSCDIE
jgi:hypothetical protein